MSPSSPKIMPKFTKTREFRLPNSTGELWNWFYHDFDRVSKMKEKERLSWSSRIEYYKLRDVIQEDKRKYRKSSIIKPRDAVVPTIIREYFPLDVLEMLLEYEEEMILHEDKKEVHFTVRPVSERIPFICEGFMFFIPTDASNCKVYCKIHYHISKSKCYENFPDLKTVIPVVFPVILDYVADEIFATTDSILKTISQEIKCSNRND